MLLMVLMRLTLLIFLMAPSIFWMYVTPLSHHQRNTSMKFAQSIWICLTRSTILIESHSIMAPLTRDLAPMMITSLYLTNILTITSQLLTDPSMLLTRSHNLTVLLIPDLTLTMTISLFLMTISQLLMITSQHLTDPSMLLMDQSLPLTRSHSLTV